MAEALMITVFLGLLIILQIIDQKKIIVFAQSSPVRKSLSILLTVAILLIFWPEHLTDQIKLVAFASVILINGFLKEGLAKDSVVRFGVLNGNFNRYPQVQVEKLGDDKSFISFYKSKNNSFSMIFDKDQTEMMDVFQKLDIHSKITLDQSSEEKKSSCKKDNE
jgi:hypothetical protein